MSDTATVHVKEVKVVKEGSNKKGKWTLYGVLDWNDDLFTWLNNRTLYDEAKAFEDQPAVLDYVTTADGYRNLKSIKPALSEGGGVEGGSDTAQARARASAAPSESAIDVRRDFAANAWEAAVHLADVEMRHKVGREITPELVMESAQKYANGIFVDLLRKGQALEDEDIPF